MEKRKWLGVILAFVVVISLVVIRSAPAGPAEIDPAKVLPKTIYAVCYDVGSSGYVQTGGIASAIMKKYGIKMRLIPSGTGVGRLAPVVTGKATYSFTADGAIYATMGMHDFSTLNWGVEDRLRTVLGHPTWGNIALGGDAGIVTPYDLKGKRMVYVPGSVSLNSGIEAALAFGNLTWDDVEVVKFASYGAGLKGLVANEVDASKSSPTASLLYQLEASPRGIAHLQFPPDDKEGWARFHEVISWYTPSRCTRGAGISEEKPVDTWSYLYPILVTLNSTPEDQVYAFVKAIDESFDLYKDVNPEMPRWAPEHSGHTKAGLPPYHPGAIRYLKEKGIFTAEDEAINKGNIAKLKKYKDAWDTVISEWSEMGKKSKEFRAYWNKRRVEIVGGR